MLLHLSLWGTVYLHAAGTLRPAMLVRESLQTRPDLAGTALDHLDFSEGRLAIHVSVRPRGCVVNLRPTDPMIPIWRKLGTKMHRYAFYPSPIFEPYLTVHGVQACSWLAAHAALLSPVGFVVLPPVFYVPEDRNCFFILFRSCHWSQKEEAANTILQSSTSRLFGVSFWTCFDTSLEVSMVTKY